MWVCFYWMPALKIVSDILINVSKCDCFIDRQSTYIRSCLYASASVCVCVSVHNCISRCRHKLFIWWAHAQSWERKRITTKKTWKRKYKQRSKTNTKKESTINNKKNHKSTHHSVYWPETDRIRVPLHRWIAFFLYYAQLWGMWGGGVEEYSGGGERGITHLISLSNRVQHLQQQHLHNTQAPLQRF